MSKKKRGNPQLNLHRNTDTTAALQGKARKSLEYSVYVVRVIFRELDRIIEETFVANAGSSAANTPESRITIARLLRAATKNQALMPRREWDRRPTRSDSSGRTCVQGHYKPATQEGVTRALRRALTHVEEVAPQLRDETYKHIRARDTETILQALLQ